MRHPNDNSFAERRKTAAEAKKQLLAKFSANSKSSDAAAPDASATDADAKDTPKTKDAL